MERYAVIVTSYPSKMDPAPSGFVHSRVRSYIKAGLDVTVLCLSNERGCYTYENVPVILGDATYLRTVVEEQCFRKILVHFLLKEIDPIIVDQNTIVWVHGFEALSWRRRLFNINWKFGSYILKNSMQLHYFRHYVNTHHSTHFVFVSNWMKEIAETDCRVSFINYSIIPNYIDETEFAFEMKSNEQANNVLIIRSFSSRKYANDISMSIIKGLEDRQYFNDLRFDIYGTGKYFKSLTSKVSHLNNVNLYERSLTHAEIHELHKTHGVFLCPTRQDAQGVSMCEAMSSGCVPITSLNTAIPEYVSDKEGFLCDNNDINSFISAFDVLQKNNNLSWLSLNAHNRMKEQCSYEKTIMREIELIRS